MELKRKQVEKLTSVLGWSYREKKGAQQWSFEYGGSTWVAASNGSGRPDSLEIIGIVDSPYKSKKSAKYFVRFSARLGRDNHTISSAVDGPGYVGWTRYEKSEYWRSNRNRYESWRGWDDQFDAILDAALTQLDPIERSILVSNVRVASEKRVQNLEDQINDDIEERELVIALIEAKGEGGAISGSNVQRGEVSEADQPYAQVYPLG